MSEIQKILSTIQAELKVPKDLHNKFGGYNYRSCESILEAVKPLLSEHEAVLLISDEVVNIGDRYYVKATADIAFEGTSIRTTAFAREPLTQKGMADPQLTGATSSYARKYALNGLFAIDDAKDADTDEHKKQTESAPKKRVNKPLMQKVTTAILDCLEAEDVLGMKETIGELSHEEQEFIWPSFDTAQRKAIKAMIHSGDKND